MAEHTHQSSSQNIAPRIREDVWELIALLKRGWKLILLSVLVSMTCMTLYLVKAKRVYQSTCRLLVLQQGGRPLNVASNDPSRSVEGYDDYIPTHSLLISSPLVVQPAIDSVGMANLPTLVAAEREGNRAIDEAILNLRVTRPDRQAKILKVDYWAGSRAEAVAMLKAVTDSYRERLEEMYEKKSNETIALISKVKNNVSEELNALEAKYLEYRRNAPYVVGDESGRSLMAQRLERSSVALKETEDNSRRLKFQLKLGEKLAREGMEMWAVAHAISQLGGDSTSLNSAINSGMSFSGSSEYVRQLISEQQQLAERYGADNTKAQAIHEQIGRIQERTRDARGRMGQAEVKDLLTSISESVKAVEALREDAVAEFARERSAAKRIEIDMLAGSNLNVQVERHRALFNTVLDQLKQAQFVSDVTSITAMAVEPPYALLKPTSPRIASFSAAALLLGVMFGIGAVLVADRMDQRIHSVKELRAVLGLPVLAQINRVRPEQLDDMEQIGLFCESKPRSLLAEGYRTVRTNIDFLKRNRRIQVILITSPRSGDGKSTSASNFAISLAQTGRRVLLIDADLRKPTQHLVHSVPNTLGMSDLLTDRFSCADVVKKTTVATLELITAGDELPNPAELLTSSRLHELIESLRDSYDFVVIDSPPILAVADPAILSAVADGVILIVRANTLRHHDAEATLERINSLATSVLGMVVNATTHEEIGYGYGYGSKTFDASTSATSRGAGMPEVAGQSGQLKRDANGHAGNGHVANGHTTNGNGHTPSLVAEPPDVPA
jgi:succinoglycan biosynthesis transport protein ExoP